MATQEMKVDWGRVALTDNNVINLLKLEFLGPRRSVYGTAFIKPDEARQLAEWLNRWADTGRLR